MPGITERHLDSNSGLRNHTFVLHGSDDDDRLYTTGDPHNLSAGDEVAFTETSLALPRSITHKIIADSGGSTRSYTIKVHGVDQFGDTVVETVSNSASGGATVEVNGAKVFAYVYYFEVISIANFVAADTITFGNDSASAAMDQDTVWGVPLKLDSSDDILGGVLFEASATEDLDKGDITFMPVVNGIKLSNDVTADAGLDRLIFINIRTTWGTA